MAQYIYIYTSESHNRDRPARLPSPESPPLPHSRDQETKEFGSESGKQKVWSNAGISNERTNYIVTCIILAIRVDISKLPLKRIPSYNELLRERGVPCTSFPTLPKPILQGRGVLCTSFPPLPDPRLQYASTCRKSTMGCYHLPSKLAFNNPHRSQIEACDSSFLREITKLQKRTSSSRTRYNVSNSFSSSMTNVLHDVFAHGMTAKRPKRLPTGL